MCHGRNPHRVPHRQRHPHRSHHHRPDRHSFTGTLRIKNPNLKGFRPSPPPVLLKNKTLKNSEDHHQTSEANQHHFRRRNRAATQHIPVLRIRPLTDRPPQTGGLARTANSEPSRTRSSFEDSPQPKLEFNPEGESEFSNPTTPNPPRSTRSRGSSPKIFRLKLAGSPPPSSIKANRPIQDFQIHYPPTKLITFV